MPAHRAFLLLALAACGGGGESVDAGPPPDAREILRPFRMNFFDTGGVRLAGVECCVRERPDLLCDTGDTNGVVRLSLPPADVSLACTLAGHEQMLIPIAPGATEELFLQMFESPVIEQALADVGFTFPGAPLVAVNIIWFDPTIMNAAGATGSISVPAEGPIYSNVGGIAALDPALTAVGDTAAFFVFGDMAEGEVEVTVQHPTLTCGISTLGGGWAGSAPNTLRVPAVNGFDTVVIFECQ